VHRAGDKILTVLVVDAIRVRHATKLAFDGGIANYVKHGITNAFLSVVRHALR